MCIAYLQLRLWLYSAYECALQACHSQLAGFSMFCAAECPLCLKPHAWRAPELQGQTGRHPGRHCAACRSLVAFSAQHTALHAALALLQSIHVSAAPRVLPSASTRVCKGESDGLARAVWHGAKRSITSAVARFSSASVSSSRTSIAVSSSMDCKMSQRE